MKISWIIPVFNTGIFLNDAVDSILAERSAAWDMEIILIDDCSTDPTTRQLLARYAEQPHIRLLCQERNSGPVAARNAGIAAATGDWVTFLDADDLVAPGTVAVRIDVIDKQPMMQWLAGDMIEIRQPGTAVHLQNFPKGTTDGVQILPAVYRIEAPLKKLASWGMLPFLGSMMIRRDLFARSGLIDESLTYGEDIHFCLVLASVADLYWIDVPCLMLRRYHESMTKDLVRGARNAPRASRACMQDRRLRSIRKEMRWHYAANLRQSSGVFLAHKMRLAAIRAAGMAVLFAPNDRRSVSAFIRALLLRK
jgi:glycosyltransferase involved in cell wall biosynthesis